MDCAEEIKQIQSRCALESTNIALMQQDIKEIKRNLGEMRRDDIERDHKLDNLALAISSISEKLDHRYAGKWVEKFAVAVITIFALASLYLIFEAVGLPR